jgi:hypothetical protein
VLTGVGRLSVWRDPPSQHAVVAQYAPHPEVDLPAAAVVLRREGDGPYALLLDEVRRGVVGLLRAPNGRGGWTFSVEVDGHRMLAWQYLHAHAEPAVAAAYDRVTSGPDALRRRPDDLLAAFIALFTILAWAGAAAGGIVAAVIGFANGEPGWAWSAVGAAVGTGILGVVVAVLVSRAMPLTPAGVEARDHLLGLREFIDVAELLRLQALQGPRSVSWRWAPSPEGRGDDRTEQIFVQSELLPYATLFASDPSWRRGFDSLTFTNPNESGVRRWFATPDGRRG